MPCNRSNSVTCEEQKKKKKKKKKKKEKKKKEKKKKKKRRRGRRGRRGGEEEVVALNRRRHFVSLLGFTFCFIFNLVGRVRFSVTESALRNRIPGTGSHPDASVSACSIVDVFIGPIDLHFFAPSLPNNRYIELKPIRLQATNSIK